MDDDAGSNSAQPAPGTVALVKRLDATKGGKFVRFLQRRKCWIVAFYAVVLVTCGYFGPQLFSNTSEVFYAPKGTPSYTNNQVVKSLFPESLKSTQLVVYIRTVNGSSVLVPAVEQFTMDLNRTLYELAPSPGFVREVEGYYLLRAMGLPASALQKFVSKDGAATMIVFEIAAYAVGKPAQNYATTLMSAMEGIAPAGGKQEVTLLGAPAFLGPSTKDVEMDMATMDGICIPIALFILWFMLRTWRLMRVPLATVIISALVSFAIMYGVSFKLRVFTVVPSLMMSLVLAVSIDYSLFLLVRYRVELSKGTPHVQAVIQMTRFAAH